MSVCGRWHIPKPTSSSWASPSTRQIPSTTSSTRCAPFPFPRLPTDRVLILSLQWIEEASRLCPNVPIILVGLKKDLREDPVAVEEMRKKSMRFVTPQEGDAVAREIGARKYLECSSLSGEGVDDVCEAATRAALLTFESGESSGCCVVL